jgi:hypothetical protein
MSLSLPPVQNANSPLSLDASGQPQATLAVPMWRKYTVGYADLSAAATTNNGTLFSLGAGEIIHATQIKHSAAFVGASVTALTISVGIAGTLAKYAAAYDVVPAVSATAFQLSTTVGKESHTAATAIKWAAVATGANLSVLTAGSVDIWVFVSKAA